MAKARTARSARRLPRTAAEALRRLLDGNASFTALAEAASRGESTTLRVDPGELGFGAHGKAPAQRPFAAVLGCADARVPVEMVFQQRSNELFVVRVAGNGIGLGGLGSFRYAAAHFAESLRLVVVLGHSQCGAVSAAVDAFLLPRTYLALASNYPLRSLVDGLLVTVRAASVALEAAHGPTVMARPGYRAALVETAVVVNAAWTAFSLQQELASAGLGVVFGRFEIGSGRVDLPHDHGRGQGLLPAPRDAQAFRRLGTSLAASPRVEALLQQSAGHAGGRIAGSHG
jgi:carbonic anhydrase